MLSAKQQARQDKLLAAQREMQQTVRSAPRPGPAAPSGPISPDVQARLDRAADDARRSAMRLLSASNRARVAALVSAVLAGGTTVYRASVEMSGALSPGEASALLEIHDAAERALRPGWTGMEHPDPRAEAARYLLSVAFDRAQASRLATVS